MIPFETEFPVRMTDHRSLIAQVIAWLRGIEASRVLDSADESEFDKDYATIRDEGGEALTLRVLRRNDLVEVIGFRHDIPDQHGRLWRTEAVLRWAAPGDGLLRLRGTCLARQADARLARPKKPFLIKAILADDLGGDDQLLRVVDTPHYLSESDEGLDHAVLALTGEACAHLPVVYLSAPDDTARGLPKRAIARLAHQLGGVAHVLVEPSRAFSFVLRDRMEGQNPFGGTVAVAVPNRGIVRRFWIGPLLPDTAALSQAIAEAVIALRSAMPASGWDWTVLQDAALREQRARERGLLADEAIYSNEIDNLEGQVANLNDRIAQLESDLALAREVAAEDRAAVSVVQVGQVLEIYEGELIDRLRAAAELALSSADRVGLDKRSSAVLRAFLSAYPQSQARADLAEEVGRATRAGAKMAQQVEKLLSRHGYVWKSNNGHARLEAKPGYDGLLSLTLSSSPSDHRTPDNLRKQILNALGLSSRGQ